MIPRAVQDKAAYLIHLNQPIHLATMCATTTPLRPLLLGPTTG